MPLPTHGSTNRSATTSARDHPFWKSERTQDEVIALGGRSRQRLLAKGDDYRIDPRMETIRMGLGWDEGFDIDASAVLFSEHGDRIDAVCFKKLKSDCGCVRHSGDNTTGKGDSDDEEITVTLGRLPLNVHHILFFVTLFDKNATFNQVKNAYVRVTNGQRMAKGDELCKLLLTEMSESAILMGQLTRRGAYWYFKALGTPVVGRDVREVLQTDTVKKHISAYPSSAPQLRHVSVAVLRGRNLAPKDFGFSFWRATATSDPYYRIKLKQKLLYTSECQSKTLKPVWKYHSFDMGWIQETDMRSLEISLFDKDQFSADDFIGMVLVKSSELFNLGPGEHTYWFSLGRPKRGMYKDEIVSGEILIRITIEEGVSTP